MLARLQRTGTSWSSVVFVAIAALIRRRRRRRSLALVPARHVISGVRVAQREGRRVAGERQGRSGRVDWKTAAERRR